MKGIATTLMALFALGISRESTDASYYSDEVLLLRVTGLFDLVHIFLFT